MLATAGPRPWIFAAVQDVDFTQQLLLGDGGQAAFQKLADGALVFLVLVDVGNAQLGLPVERVGRALHPDVYVHAQAEEARDADCYDDARSAAGRAVNGKADRLLLEHGNELLVHAVRGLVARKSINRQPHRPNVERDQPPVPLHLRCTGK